MFSPLSLLFRLLCPLFPWPLRRLLALLCCCSALGRRPAPSSRRCCAAQRVRLRGLSNTSRRRQPSETHLRMSGGKACGKQAAPYAGKQPDEGSAVTSRDTAAAENGVHRLATRTESQCTSKKCLLPGRLWERGKPRKASSLLRRRRGRAPRGKLRGRKQRCSPSCRRFTSHTGRRRVSF